MPLKLLLDAARLLKELRGKIMLENGNVTMKALKRTRQ